MKSRLPLKVLLAAPRSFCAGVTRAIQIVEACLEHYGAPVYVRHAIVHNEHVLREMEAKGVIFVEELSEVPDGVPVVFSAHGVPPSVVRSAEERGLPTIDATCPLVARVHQEAMRHHRSGCQVLVIGKKNHPEILGLLGYLPAKECQVIGDIEAAKNVQISMNQPVAYVTQTTLSVEDTGQIVKVLRKRFPKLIEPRTETICYATANRQKATRAIAAKTEAFLVLGSPTSSNSSRLTEVARQVGCEKVRLVPEPDELNLRWLDDVSVLGLTAGASAPEYLVQQLIDRLAQSRSLVIEEVSVTEEKIHFRLPIKRFPKTSQISISRSPTKSQHRQEGLYRNKHIALSQELHLA